MKKRLALLMALVMVFSLFCVGAPAAFADDVTLTLWSIATESDSSHQAFVDGIAAFEAEHPGVKIEHVTTENEAYKTKIKAAMSSGEGLSLSMPAVFTASTMSMKPIRMSCPRP